MLFKFFFPLASDLRSTIKICGCQRLLEVCNVRSGKLNENIHTLCEAIIDEYPEIKGKCSKIAIQQQ